MSKTVENAVKAASAKWQQAFNSGNAAGCAACYEENAVMVATPFGTFTGRQEIQAFWQKLIADGFSDVKYANPNIEVIDDTSARVTAGWTMNKAQGVISNELWVIQDNGEALLREDHFEAKQ